MAETVDRSELVRRFILDGMDDVETSVVEETCADEVKLLDSDASIPAETIVQQVAHMYAAIPDLHHDILEMWEDDDTVIVHYRNTGTFEEPLVIEDDPMFGDRKIEPTGEDVEYNGVYLVRVEDGQITAWRNYADRLAWLQQVGVLPSLDELME